MWFVRGSNTAVWIWRFSSFNPFGPFSRFIIFMLEALETGGLFQSKSMQEDNVRTCNNHKLWYDLLWGPATDCFNRCQQSNAVGPLERLSSTFNLLELLISEKNRSTTVGKFGPLCCLAQSRVEISSLTKAEPPNRSLDRNIGYRCLRWGLIDACIGP